MKPIFGIFMLKYCKLYDLTSTKRPSFIYLNKKLYDFSTIKNTLFFVFCITFSTSKELTSQFSSLYIQKNNFDQRIMKIFKN